MFHEDSLHVFSFVFVLTSVSVIVVFNSETNTTDEAASSLCEWSFFILHVFKSCVKHAAAIHTDRKSPLLLCVTFLYVLESC